MRLSKIVILLAIITVILIIAFVTYIFIQKPFSNSQNSSTKSVSEILKGTPVPTMPLITTVELTDSGFDPDTIQINQNDVVTFVNKSSSKGTVNSEPYPENNLHKFLNLGAFEPGSILQAQFANKGQFKYHNHLKPAQKGTVIVK